MQKIMHAPLILLCPPGRYTNIWLRIPIEDIRNRNEGVMRILQKTIICMLLALSGTVCVTTQAETVSQRQAKKIAAQFFNAAHGQVMAEPKLVYNGRRLTTNSLFPPFYVYNLQSGGFVIISAENKAFPILGYSLTENFSPDKTGDTEKELLRLYALHIENIRYDSTVAYEAERCWLNLPEYIAELLAAPYKATDPVTTKEEAKQELDLMLDMEDSYGFASANYSPSQWQYTIDMELDTKPDVILGLVKGESLIPVIVHGRKGDYYRMELDGRNNSLWRLLPTEVLSKGEVAVLGMPGVNPEPEMPEEPHKFYEDFVAQTLMEHEAKQAAMERDLTLCKPQIQWTGGGHFTVSLPEEMEEMRLYNLYGTQVQVEKFRETNVGSINVTGQPTGFYFAVFFGKSGKPYSFKIFR